MFIKEVNVIGLGPLKDLTVGFDAPGLNLILGPNECGKSTLCRAIEAILYGFESKIDVEAQRSWAGGDRMTGSLLLEVNGDSYSVERDFETDHTRVVRFSNGEEDVLFDGDANPRGRTEEPRRYAELLTHELGLPSRSIFQSSGYVEQLQLELEIDDELRRQISGAGQADYKKAEEILREQYYSLTRVALPGERARQSDRRIEELESEIEVLNSDLNDAREYTERMADLTDEREKLQAEQRLNMAQASELDNEVEALKEYLALLKRGDEVYKRDQAEKKHRSQIEKLQKEIKLIDKELGNQRFLVFRVQKRETTDKLRQYLHSDAERTIAKIEGLRQQEKALHREIEEDRFTPLRQAPDNSRELLMALKRQRSAVSNLEKKLAISGREIKRPSRLSLWAIPLGMLLLGAIIGAGIGLLLRETLSSQINPSITPVFGSLICGSASLFIGLLFVAFLSARANKRSVDQVADEARLEDIRKALHETEEKLQPVLFAARGEIAVNVLLERWEALKEKREALDKLLAERQVHETRDVLKLRKDPELMKILGTASAEVLRERLGHFDELQGRRKASLETLSGLDHGETIAEESENPERELQEILARIGSIQRTYPSFEGYKKNTDAGRARLERKQKELEKVRTAQQGIENGLHQIDIDETELRVSFKASVVLLEEEIEQNENQLTFLKSRGEALGIAIEVLRESIEEYERGHLARLSRCTSDYFSRFTSGRYAAVDIEHGHDLRVDRADEDYFSIDLLSIGARDQLFFALRLAVADLLASDVKLPLVLDDPFVNFDDERLIAVKGVVVEIAKERQVILLVHDYRFKEWPGTFFEFR